MLAPISNVVTSTVAKTITKFRFINDCTVPNSEQQLDIAVQQCITEGCVRILAVGVTPLPTTGPPLRENRVLVWATGVTG